MFFFSLLTLSIHDEGYSINKSCALNLISMFLLKKDNILPVITPPVSFVSATYLCYLNHIIYLCSFNIVRVLFNSVFNSTIMIYSNVCYIYNDRPSSSQNIHWLYIYIYYIPQQWHFILNSYVTFMFKYFLSVNMFSFLFRYTIRFIYRDSNNYQ